MFWIGKPAYLRRFGQLDDHIRTIESAGSHFRAGGGYLGNRTLKLGGGLMDSPRRLLGIFFLFIGAACGLVSHYALLWKVGYWVLPKRLAIGIPGWGIASIFLWHGFTLLMIP